MTEFIIKILVIITSVMYSESNKTMDPFIVGGDYTKIKNFPHAVFLSVRCGANWICGASVLTQRLLITAAHCLEECAFSKGWYVKVLAGSDNLATVKVIRSIKRFLVHKHYNTETVKNDIALAFMGEVLPLGKNIKRVIVRPGYRGTVQAAVSGWGTIDEKTDRITLKLKSVDVRVQPRTVCQNYLDSFEPGMMCAGAVSDTAAHPSTGDSGSGLITNDYQMIGLVSYRQNNVRSLVIYTNVSYFYKWITQKSRYLNCFSNKIV